MLKRFSIFTMFQVIALVGMLAFGQTAKFKAVVVDDATGEPLPYASVYVSPEKGTMTNDEGEFSLVLTEGEEIRISYVGYETMHTTA
ncbi:MAG: carboxypeptidase-like regulatory domain-containing protein [Bacteroidaceae bacterium]|nr:carboxypeptidase-like regulatory domain-containing protein [Bacteroidaceae bacterium]